jgi:hypothetical protein
MKKLAILTVCVSLATVGAFAKDSITQQLNSVPAAELPASAANLVKQAKARDWGKTTVEVVKSAVQINPAAAPAVVGAIARSVPEMAHVAAEIAATEQPKQAAAIAKAAAAAAPTKAGKIVTSVCRAVPSEYQSVAVAVSQAAPGSSREVLKAVASVNPDLKPSIEGALERQTSGTLPVANTLQTAAGQGRPPVASGPLPKGPTIEPPFVPIPNTPTTITPATSGEVPPGGRNYAKP